MKHNASKTVHALDRHVFRIAILLCCIFVFNTCHAQDKPNIVVILADDLGYGDVQPLNSSSKIPTPNFNRIAAEGITFTDAHSASSVCTPTRYGLLCGRYPWRSKLKKGVLGGYSRPLIEDDRQTLASLLKGAGYKTGCVGKWHLGLGWQMAAEAPKEINKLGIPGKPGFVDYSKPLTYGPNTLGFDFSFINPASLDMSPYVYVRNDRATAIPDKAIEHSPFPKYYRKGEIADDFKIDDVLDRFTKEACDFVRRSSQQKSPFFLYFPLSAPHKPVMPQERFQGKTELGDYGDFVHQVDWTVGQVLDVLEETEQRQNTLVIVTSDNGSFMKRTSKPDDHIKDSNKQAYNPENHTANGKWRGTKADIWEAGHRVPFYASWPGRTEKGTTCDSIVCQTDILATVAGLLDIEFDRKSAKDSFSFQSLLEGKTRERIPVIHHSINGQLAIRDGDWKLILGSGSGGREQPRGKPFEEPYILMNLAENPTEKKESQADNAEKIEELVKQFNEIAQNEHLPPAEPAK